MTAEALAGLLRQSLIALGVAFVIVDLRVGLEILRWIRQRGHARVVWSAPRPPFYFVNLAIGVMLGVLLLVTVLLGRPSTSIFGVAMMFGYYGYLLPLSTRIRRGLYDDGMWTDGGFIRYDAIGGVAWEGDGSRSLIVALRRSATGRRLAVPGPCLGEVRRILREKIGSHAIPVDEGPGIHLGSRDTRESV